MVGDDAAVRIDENRVAQAELCHASRDLRFARRNGCGIPCVGDQALARPGIESGVLANVNSCLKPSSLLIPLMLSDYYILSWEDSTPKRFVNVFTEGSLYRRTLEGARQGWGFVEWQ